MPNRGSENRPVIVFGHSSKHKDMKRTVDLVIAGVGLLLLAPVFLLIAIAITLDSAGPILFPQERVGRHFRTFVVLKFRTMVVDATKRGGRLTVDHDPRITRVGAGPASDKAR